MNKFAETLKALLSKTQIKHSTIAQKLQYDESYISKWLAGRALPSEKHIRKVVGGIAACIVEEASQAETEELYREYHVSDNNELCFAIEKKLLSAYSEKTTAYNSDGFTVEETMMSVVNSIDLLADNMIILADLFSMDHESRLLLAGIQYGRFTPGTFSHEKRCLKMIICMESMSDVLYDCLLLVHMLTAHSNISFELYGNNKIAGKLLCSDDDSHVVSAMMLDGSHCLAVSRPKNSGERMFQSLKTFCTQETLLFQKIDSLFENHLYISSLLSSDLCCLTGHFTEQMIPESLYISLCEDMSDEEARINTLLRTGQNKVRLMIYRSAFSKLMINGELDFFNQKKNLTLQQQRECLIYIRHLAEMGRIRIVDKGGFSLDFHYITDPCIFLSDTVDYVRLENGQYENNLFHISDRKCRKYYHDFFEKAWDNKDVVISGREDVIKLIDSYIAQMEVLR